MGNIRNMQLRGLPRSWYRVALPSTPSFDSQHKSMVDKQQTPTAKPRELLTDAIVSASLQLIQAERSPVHLKRQEVRQLPGTADRFYRLTKLPTFERDAEASFTNDDQANLQGGGMFTICAADGRSFLSVFLAIFVRAVGTFMNGLELVHGLEVVAGGNVQRGLPSALKLKL